MTEFFVFLNVEHKMNVNAKKYSITKEEQRKCLLSQGAVFTSKFLVFVINRKKLENLI